MNSKIRILIIFLILIFINRTYSQKLNNENIEENLLQLLIKYKDATDDKNYYPKIFCYDIINECVISMDSILKQDVTICRIATNVTPSYKHFIIGYESRYYFINMRRPIGEILGEVLFHLEQSKLFSKEISIECVKNVLKTYDLN
jgi:hypothetical protein